MLRCLFKIIFLICSHQTFAHINVPFEVGYYNAKIGHSQLIPMVNLEGNQYTINQSDQQNVLLGLGAFKEFINDWKFGVLMNYFNTSKITGIIQEENLFSNLSYQYAITQLPIYVSAQKTIPWQHQAFSWIFQTGIGPNVIFLHDYKETPLTSYSLSNHTFNPSTHAYFSAFGGLGIQFSQKFQLSYRFYYLGQSELSPKNQGVLDRLSTTNIYANTFVFSYLFE